MDKRTFYSCNEAAVILGCHRQTVKVMIERGELRGQRMHPGMKKSKYVIPVSEVMRKKAEWENGVAYAE